jgi:hypothetical protein
MILSLLVAAAQAAALPQSAAPPVSPSAQDGAFHRAPRRQLFVAPSGEPFRAAPDAAYPVADWFARANTTHDGKLTEAQFTADFVAFVATLDTNHDGTIDAAELQNYETNILPEVHAPDFGDGRGGDLGGGGHRHHDGSGGSGGGGPERPQGAGRFGLLPLPEPVAAMDTELKGRITREAVIDAAHARFGQLDTAHRGYLVLSELPKTWTQTRREMFRQRREQGGGDSFGPRGGMGADDRSGSSGDKDQGN